jgi:predicted regulator of Ras-like GTPase activity (Roadblock/LC7/MglB family)
MSRQQAAVGVGHALCSLRDVGGVHGSFVLSPAGELIGKDLPAVFDERVFAEVGPRIARLRDTFASVGDPVDSCVLRFAEHKLFLRAMDEGTVGVLLTLTANMPALKMAVTLAVRGMATDLALYQNSPPEPPVRSSVPPPVLAPPAPRARARVVFRGHEVK